MNRSVPTLCRNGGDVISSPSSSSSLSNQKILFPPLSSFHRVRLQKGGGGGNTRTKIRIMEHHGNRWSIGSHTTILPLLLVVSICIILIHITPCQAAFFNRERPVSYQHHHHNLLHLRTMVPFSLTPSSLFFKSNKRIGILQPAKPPVSPGWISTTNARIRTTSTIATHRCMILKRTATRVWNVLLTPSLSSSSASASSSSNNRNNKSRSKEEEGMEITNSREQNITTTNNNASGEVTGAGGNPSLDDHKPSIVTTDFPSSSATTQQTVLRSNGMVSLPPPSSLEDDDTRDDPVVELLEEMVSEVIDDAYYYYYYDDEDEDFVNDADNDFEPWNEYTLADFLSSVLPEDDTNYYNNRPTLPPLRPNDIGATTGVETNRKEKEDKNDLSESSWLQSSLAMSKLEKALMQGVVPVSAGVGDDQLPGDYGFDPLQLATKDYYRNIQQFFINFIPPSSSSSQPGADTQSVKANNGKNRSTSSVSLSQTTTTTITTPSSLNTTPNVGSNNRPRALILRDYREAEIRHGRLAMLAAIFWPLQEMLDELLLDEDLFGPLLYGPVTLPYFPLLMTAIMLLLGYLDIYSQAMKDRDTVGEAFLPGDCLWDPLSVLQGAPDRMVRNMQERELLNGRFAMIAIAAYIWEEGITHEALIHLASNDLLFQPAYQVPFIQQWLDQQFYGNGGLR